MKKGRKEYLVGLLVVGAVWMIITLGCFLTPAKESSSSERRKLAQFPKFSIENVVNGQFMSKFEEYTLDQFPLRDTMRQIKSSTSRHLFRQKDSNGYYMVGDVIGKLDYPLKEGSVMHALNLMENLVNTYMDEEKQNIYVSVVPDKGYFLADENGYPSMDYAKMFSLVKSQTPYAKYIDITHLLDIGDYYKTDTHWRQEELEDVAALLKKEMGVKLPESSYEQVEASDSFYGVYAGQSAFSVKPDQLTYLTNPTLESCVVDNMEDKEFHKIYNLDKVRGRDPYDLYLSGATPLLTIQNPNAKTDKELIVFRDSFGSSIAPLLVDGYSKVTLVDIRYMKSSLVGDYLTFHNQDVLFLYSSLLLNSSFSMS
ncbi:MAG: hypothetical protein IKL07_10325 [Clostridium sp.]|nr:hypothetical protein [Clostridium sp.]